MSKTIDVFYTDSHTKESDLDELYRELRWVNLKTDPEESIEDREAGNVLWEQYEESLKEGVDNDLKD